MIVVGLNGRSKGVKKIDCTVYHSRQLKGICAKSVKVPRKGRMRSRRTLNHAFMTSTSYWATREGICEVVGRIEKG